MAVVTLGYSSCYESKYEFIIPVITEYNNEATYKFHLNEDLWQFELFVKPTECRRDYGSDKERHCQLQLVTAKDGENKTVKLVRLEIITTVVPLFGNQAPKNEMILSPVGLFYRNGDMQHYRLPNCYGNMDVKIVVLRSTEPIGSDVQSFTKNQIEAPMSQIRSEVLKWFKSEDFGDVTVVASDGITFRCHKDILSARSDVLKLMFNCPMKESKENLVEIDDYEGIIVASLLQFIYIDECSEIGPIADLLYVAAHHYQLERLKVLCESAMAANLSANSIVKTYRLASFYQLDKLLAICVDYLDTNKADLPIADLFAEAMKLGEREVQTAQK